MRKKEAVLHELHSTREFFNKSTSCLQEEDSAFAPAEGAMTAAQQVAHAAHSVDWFVEGAFRPEGFELDFEEFGRKVAAHSSLEVARKFFNEAFDRAIATIESKSWEDLLELLPEGPVMGGQRRLAIISGIVDHTAHHRGALTVYSRLRGHTPEMPY